VIFGYLSHSEDKIGFSFRVCNSVVVKHFREPQFEVSIFLCNLGVFDEVVPKEESMPVLKVPINHMYVMSSVLIFVTFDEPCLKGQKYLLIMVLMGLSEFRNGT